MLGSKLSTLLLQSYHISCLLLTPVPGHTVVRYCRTALPAQTRQDVWCRTETLSLPPPICPQTQQTCNHLTLFCLVDYSIFIYWKSAFVILGVSVVLFLFLVHFSLKCLWTNSVDPYQTLHSAASDLGLQCLPRSPKRDTRNVWIKVLSSVLTLVQKSCISKKNDHSCFLAYRKWKVSN